MSEEIKTTEVNWEAMFLEGQKRVKELQAELRQAESQIKFQAQALRAVKQMAHDAIDGKCELRVALAGISGSLTALGDIPYDAEIESQDESEAKEEDQKGDGAQEDNHQ